MTFTDTHCHIHEASYPDAEAAYQTALEAGVARMICVGTALTSSQEAVQFASKYVSAWAVIGIHPHEAVRDGGYVDELSDMLLVSSGILPKTKIQNQKSTKIVGIGEIGLDYYYHHSPRAAQITVLEAQLQIAVDYNLPVSFHVRDAFDDFWPIFDSFQGLRGVLHSYTDNLSNLDKALSRGLLIGVNGISTFATDKQALYQAIPVDHLMLETDAPYLTPIPHRGKVNEPAFITFIAKHIANLQSINLQELSRVTEQNASRLFAI